MEKMLVYNNNNNLDNKLNNSIKDLKLYKSNSNIENNLSIDKKPNKVSIDIEFKTFDLKLCVINHFQKHIKGNTEVKTNYKIEVVLYEYIQTNDSKFNINNNIQKTIPCKENIYTLDKTFEDFENLCKNLKNNNICVPKAPKKGVFSAKTPEELNKRKNKLDTFLNKCVENSNIKYNPIFIKFLGLDLMSNICIKKISEIDSCNFGSYSLKKLIYLKDFLFYAVLNNPNVLSKKFYNNKNFCIKNNIDGQICPGKIIAIGISNNKLVEYNSYELLFKDCISDVYTSNKLLFVGLNNGVLCYSKIDEKEKDNVFKDIKIFKSNEILSIGAIDDSVFLLSKYKLKILCLNSKSIVSEKKLSGQIKCGLFLNNYKVYLIGTSDGYVQIYSLQTNSCNFVTKINTNNKCKINCLNICNNMIFSANKDGLISIFDIINDNAIFNIILKKQFKSKLTIVDIFCRKDNNEIILLDSSSNITFWNIDGLPTYTFKCRLNYCNKLLVIDKFLICSNKESYISYYMLNDYKDEITSVENFIKDDLGNQKSKQNILVEDNKLGYIPPLYTNKKSDCISVENIKDNNKIDNVCLSFEIKNNIQLNKTNNEYKKEKYRNLSSNSLKYCNNRSLEIDKVSLEKNLCTLNNSSLSNTYQNSQNKQVKNIKKKIVKKIIKIKKPKI